MCLAEMEATKTKRAIPKDDLLHSVSLCMLIFQQNFFFM